MSRSSAARAVLFSKPVRWIAGAFAALIAAALAVVYGDSAWRMARTYDTPAQTLRLTQAPSAERGERLGSVFGCKDCHGTHGRIFFEVPMIGRLIAPDLARAAQNYNDAELVTVLRQGVKRDRTSAIVMPADAFSSLSDDDVADVIAWMRALKPETETETAETTLGPLGRFAVISGGFPFSADMPHDPAPPAARPTAKLALGEYLVKSSCNHCHRLDEEHVVKPGLTAPPVRPMTQSYDLDQFKHLLRTGKALGDRELVLMSDVARSAFSRLDEAEVEAIHAYLNAPSQ